MELMEARRRILLNSPHVEEKSGAIVNLKTDMKAPLKKCVVSFAPIQEGSGDPSPDNIRPISGWDGVSVYHTNENLWDDDAYACGNILTLETNPESPFYGFYKGAMALWRNAVVDSHFCKLPNTNRRITVTATFGATDSFTFRVLFYYDDGTTNYISNISLSGGQIATTSRTSSSGKNCIGYAIGTSAGTTNMRGRIKDVFVQYADDTSEYVAPNSSLIPITWQSSAGTVYGGQLDVMSGVLTAEWYAEDLSQKSWTSRYTGTTQKTLSTSLTYAYPRSKGSQIIAENYILASVSGVTSLSNPDTKDIGIYWYNNSGNSTPTTLYAVTDVNTTPSGLVVYSLATPITYQLTPQQIQTLKGINNIWSNGNGQTDIKFWTH